MEHILCVPKGWKHPTDAYGHYIPLHRQDYDQTAQKWKREMYVWEEGRHFKKSSPYFWEVAGPPPRRDHYLSFASHELTCYQVYSDEKIGIPVSPVFNCLDDLEKWLIQQGRLKAFAEAFTRYGFATPAQKNDGIGYFHLTRDFRVGCRRLVRFIINGHAGDAILINDPSSVGLYGSAVVEMYINILNAAHLSKDYLFAYPDEEGKHYDRPDFLESLIVLLENLGVSSY